MAFTDEEEQAFIKTLREAQHRAAQAFLQGNLKEAQNILLSTLKELPLLNVKPVMYSRPYGHELRDDIRFSKALYSYKIHDMELGKILDRVCSNIDYLHGAHEHLNQQLRIAGYYLCLDLKQPQLTSPGQYSPSELKSPAPNQPDMSFHMDRLEQIAKRIYIREHNIINSQYHVKSTNPSEAMGAYGYDVYERGFDSSFMRQYGRTSAAILQVVMKGEHAQNEDEKIEINSIRLKQKFANVLCNSSSSAQKKEAQESNHHAKQESSSPRALLNSSGYNTSLNTVENKAAEEEDMQIKKSAQTMHEELSVTKAEFKRTGDTETFIKSSEASLRKAEPVLNKSSSWKQVLLDILSALIFIATLSLSYVVTGRFRLFSVAEQNTSNENIQELEHMRTPEVIPF